VLLMVGEGTMTLKKHIRPHHNMLFGCRAFFPINQGAFSL
jgi:hypothetical protein